ncbi:hypothetical protein DCMF_20070 [Candidatus Formimonas warabiya]|uniref:Sodium:solute symporter family protein n=2 Tax=Formimonas warabiya TaxID=1761012 RepID=A0A3G1KW36_FORW1|nr:hypothetical protein DCMF_20070 [Candidatus Formimonas warabiya]
MSSTTIALLTVTVIYILIMLSIAYMANKRAKSEITDYFVGSGSFGTLVIFWTLYATLFSAWTFLGMAGGGFKQGLGWWVLALADMSLGFTGLYFGSRLWVLAQKNKYVTPSDFLSDRYQSNFVRYLVAIMSLIAVIPHVSIQITGIGTIYEGLSQGQISFNTGLVVFLILLTITTVVGLRSVAWSDVLQGIILFVALWIAMFSILASSDVGGLTSVVQKIMNTKPELLGFPGGGGYFTQKNWIAWFFMLGPAIVTYPQMIVKYFGAKNLFVVSNTSKLMPYAIPLTTFPVVFCGLIGAAVLPELSNPDMVIPTLLATYVHPAVASILGMGAIAAAMSTVSAIMLVASSILIKDVIARINPDMPEKRLVFWGRVCVMFWVGVCLVLGIWNPTMIALMGAYALRATGLAFFIPILGALFWPRSTKQGVCAAMVTGFVVGALTSFVWPTPFGFDAVYWGFAAEAIVYFAVSYATAPPPEAHLRRFFDDVDEALSKTRIKVAQEKPSEIKL